MNDSATGQVSRTAADVYEEFFVPALFAEWAEPVVDAAGIGAGQQVLDVACGTGILARTAADRVGANGAVVGLDVNDGMLAVARRMDTRPQWRLGRAEELPFEDGRFDAVVSQFGLMFFTDRLLALQEMARTVRPGGRVVVAVWDALDRTPGYAAMVQLLEDLFGAEVADGLRAPFALGDPADLAGLCAAAGLDSVAIDTRIGTARFPSIDDWVHTDIKGWTLADDIDEQQYGELRAAARERLQRFVTADMSVAFDSPAHIVTIRIN